VAQSLQTRPASLNGQYANGPFALVTDPLFLSALRELRSDLTKRPVIVGLISFGALLGISGPFDTLRLLPLFPRLCYWLAVVGLGFSVGAFVGHMVHTVLREQAAWLRLAVSSLAIGAGVTAVLIVLNRITFNFWPETLMELLELFGMVALISGVIEVGSFFLRQEGERQDGVVVAESSAPLLQRLSFDVRAPLIGISAEDHYVRVTTTKGEEMVLMRFSDALKEVGGTKGLQIHRSHWVALDQIAQVTRSGDRGEVLFKDGSSRPISRGFLSGVRDAGLLPSGRS